MSVDLAAAFPFLAAALLSLSARPLARRLPPHRTVVLLTGSAIVVSLATGLVLYALAAPGLAEFPPLAAAGHWSVRDLRLDWPLPAATSVGLAILATTLLACGTTTLLMAVRALIRTVHAVRVVAGAPIVARTAAGRTDARRAPLHVVDDDVPSAYAVGARRGRIVVTTAMLDALSAAEQRVLVAHEEAHLRHRHNLVVIAVRMAAAANPMLRPVVPVVTQSVERAADEAAATVVGDRVLAARSVARAAVVRRSQLQATGRLAATGGDVPNRVRSLLAPPQRGQGVLCAAVAAVALAAGYTSILTADCAQDQLESAQTVYAAAHHDDVHVRPVDRPHPSG